MPAQLIAMRLVLTLSLLAACLVAAGCATAARRGFVLQLNTPLPQPKGAPFNVTNAVGGHAELQSAFLAAYELLRPNSRKFESPEPIVQRYELDAWGDASIDLRYRAQRNRVEVRLTTNWTAADEERERWGKLLAELRDRFTERFGTNRIDDLPWVR